MHENTKIKTVEMDKKCPFLLYKVNQAHDTPEKCISLADLCEKVKRHNDHDKYLSMGQKKFGEVLTQLTKAGLVQAIDFKKSGIDISSHGLRVVPSTTYIAVTDMGRDVMTTDEEFRGIYDQYGNSVRAN
jgi:hypothetical protein